MRGLSHVTLQQCRGGAVTTTTTTWRLLQVTLHHYETLYSKYFEPEGFSRRHQVN